MDDTSDEESFVEEIIDEDELADLLEDQHGQEDFHMEEINDELYYVDDGVRPKKVDPQKNIDSKQISDGVHKEVEQDLDGVNKEVETYLISDVGEINKEEIDGRIYGL